MSRIVAILEAIDEAGNAALGTDPRIPLAGNPHATISQRLGQMIVMGTPRQQALAKECDAMLTWIENKEFGGHTESHCLDSIAGFPMTLPSTG
jgi:hypothetical protein